jgi:hypothetical protein
MLSKASNRCYVRFAKKWDMFSDTAAWQTGSA